MNRVHCNLRHIMRIFVIVLIVFGTFFFSFAYGDEIKYTSFDIDFPSQYFDLKGPNHQILILDYNESASIPITIVNHDTKPHEIFLSIPEIQNPSYVVENYSFSPPSLTIPPNSENQTKLELKIKNQTDSQWGQIHILAKSKDFGMAGKYFYLAIGKKDIEIDPFIDYSLRSDLPGPAFPFLYNDFSSSYLDLYYLDDSTPNNIGIPRYLPEGYSFQGLFDQYSQFPFLIFAKNPITNNTESFDFIQKGGIMVYYGVDGINVNRTSFTSDYISQEEAKQISINGLEGTASDLQERVVAYDEVRYMFPAEINLSDGQYSSVGLRGNIGLDELVKMAESMPISGNIESPIVISKVELYGPSSFFSKNVRVCFDDSNTLGPWAVGWIEIQNKSDDVVTIPSGSVIKIGNWQFGGPLTLEAGEKCIIQTDDIITTRDGPGGINGNSPPIGYQGSSKSIKYFINDSLFVNQTPEFSDVYGDTKIWQLLGDKWSFGPSPYVDYSDIKNLSAEELRGIPPLKQFKNNIPIENIHCKERLILIQKYDGSPACVTLESSFKLSERGWEIWRDTINLGPIDPDLP